MQEHGQNNFCVILIRNDMGGFKSLKEGQKIFEATQGPKGNQASSMPAA